VSRHAPVLPGVFHTLAPVLNHYGYAAVGALVLLEDFGIPVPGETVLIAAAVYAGAGRLNVVAVGLIAFAAAVIGDNIGYAIGHFAGRAAVLRWGRYVFLSEERLDKAEAFFTRHGGKIVTVARFIEGLRQANGIIAGLAEMPWLRFLAFNAAGALLWVALWVSIGYSAGSHLASLYGDLTRYELYLGIAVLALIVLLVVRRLVKRRRERPGGAAPAGEPPSGPRGAGRVGTGEPAARTAQTPAEPTEPGRDWPAPRRRAGTPPGPGSAGNDHAPITTRFGKDRPRDGPTARREA
jgi:membrane protein DedA with SNARE-associated domain